MKKTIKIIDLLVKIANGEEVPKKIKYQCYTFEFNGRTYIDNENDSITEHILSDLSNINYEVEIIEEDKKIEKLPTVNINNETMSDLEIYLRQDENCLIHKINEIIDAVNSMNKGE